MKTHIALIILLASALSASVLSASPRNESPIAYSTVNVYVGGDQIKRGVPRERVRALLGNPSQELSHDVWLYHSFKTDLRQANEQGCRSMIITFANHEVVDLKIVNAPAATIIAANLKLHPSIQYIASKK